MTNIFVPLGKETILRPHYAEKLAMYGINLVPFRYNLSNDAQASKVYSVCSGVLLVGGVDINPEKYAQPKIAATNIDKTRDEIDFPVLDASYHDGKPILGVCRGAEAIGVHKGMQLIQDMQLYLGPNIELHSAEKVPETLAALVTSEIDILGDSRLGRILGKTKAQVVCAHHQALDYKPNPYLKLSAISKAGIPEAWEGYNPDHFVLATQFHPELGSGPTDKIFEAFAKASEEYKFKR